MNPDEHTQLQTENHIPDASLPQQQAPMPSIKPTRGQRLKRLLRRPAFWLTLLAGIVVTALIVWFVQPARWWVVNALGARNTLSVTTISPGEGSKAKPSQLKNVAVTIDGKTFHTDEKGNLQATGIRYGKVNIMAKKAGYQDARSGATLDFDPFFHKFGGKTQDDAVRSIELSLTATGMPVSFKVVDAFSGKPVSVGEFTIGDVVAKPDELGQVSLKIPGTDDSKATVRARFGGSYVDTTFDVMLGTDSQQISVVP